MFYSQSLKTLSGQAQTQLPPIAVARPANAATPTSQLSTRYGHRPRKSHLCRGALDVHVTKPKKKSISHPGPSVFRVGLFPSTGPRVITLVDARQFRKNLHLNAKRAPSCV